MSYLSENENQNHADVELGLLGVGSDTSVTDDSDGQTCQQNKQNKTMKEGKQARQWVRGIDAELQVALKS